MSQIPIIISFIGHITGATSLIGLPSNPVIRVLAEASIIIGTAGAIYALYHLAFGMIMQGGSPGRAETLSLVVVTAFVLSYIAFRLGGGLRKAKGSWRGMSLKAAATTILAGLLLVAVAYPYPVDSERLPEVDVILRSETTGDIWVIEVEREDNNWEIGVERDTVYLASATIVGLATFGSLLSVRVLGSPKTLKPRKRGFFIISIGVGMTIGFQSILMHKACCGSISAVLFECLLFATVVALVLIACGFSLIRDSWFKDGTDSSSPRK